MEQVTALNPLLLVMERMAQVIIRLKILLLLQMLLTELEMPLNLLQQIILIAHKVLKIILMLLETLAILHQDPSCNWVGFHNQRLLELNQ